MLETWGSSVEGLVLFGSFARGRQTANSDIDLLVVLNRSVTLDRDIYSRWRLRKFEGREVAPLFVQIPGEGERIGGLWFEVALDGIVLFDRDLRLSRFLSHVRDLVAGGRVRRMVTHGHPYWVHSDKVGQDLSSEGGFMRNLDLAKDYLLRAGGRLKAVDTLLAERMWADVVRECQEIVELALKGLLRHHDIEVPRVHDVSEVLEENSARFPRVVREALEELMEISQELRRDRELAFYGSEDITPHSFYKEKHARVGPATRRARGKRLPRSLFSF